MAESMDSGRHVQQISVGDIIARFNITASQAKKIAVWLNMADATADVFMEKAKIGRGLKDRVYGFYEAMHGKCIVIDAPEYRAEVREINFPTSESLMAGGRQDVFQLSDRVSVLDPIETVNQARPFAAFADPVQSHSWAGCSQLMDFDPLSSDGRSDRQGPSFTVGSGKGVLDDGDRWEGEKRKVLQDVKQLTQERGKKSGNGVCKSKSSVRNTEKVYLHKEKATQERISREEKEVELTSLFSSATSLLDSVSDSEYSGRQDKSIADSVKAEEMVRDLSAKSGEHSSKISRISRCLNAVKQVQDSWMLESRKSMSDMKRLIESLAEKVSEDRNSVKTALDAAQISLQEVAKIKKELGQKKSEKEVIRRPSAVGIQCEHSPIRISTGLDVDSEEEEPEVRRDQRVRKDQNKSPPKMEKRRPLPKLEKFSGKESWKDFGGQFCRYKSLSGWSIDEATAYLGLYLTGDALRYFNQLSIATQNNLGEAMAALDRRFGRLGTTEAQKAAFHNLHQKEKESINDFADRVRGVALEAFPSLPSDYVEEETIRKFLEGVVEKEAGLHCLNNKYSCLERAVGAVQIFVENQRCIFGPRRVRRTGSPEMVEEGDRVARVRFKGEEKSDSEERKEIEKVGTEKEKMGTESNKEIKDMLLKLQNTFERYVKTDKILEKGREQALEEKIKEMEAQLNMLRNGRRDSSPGRSTNRMGGKERSRSPIECFRCREKGHMARECTQAPAWRTSPLSRSPASSPEKGRSDLNAPERV